MALDAKSYDTHPDTIEQQIACDEERRQQQVDHEVAHVAQEAEPAKTPSQPFTTSVNAYRSKTPSVYQSTMIVMPMEVSSQQTVYIMRTRNSGGIAKSASMRTSATSTAPPAVDIAARTGVNSTSIAETMVCSESMGQNNPKCNRPELTCLHYQKMGRCESVGRVVLHRHRRRGAAARCRPARRSMYLPTDQYDGPKIPAYIHNSHGHQYEGLSCRQATRRVHFVIPDSGGKHHHRRHSITPTIMSTQPRTISAFACFNKGEALKSWDFPVHALDADDVEIKISHCDICGSDIHSLDSGWGATTYPYVVGHEIVGEVTLTGANVTELRVGDRVGVGAQVDACLKTDPKAADYCKQCAQGADAYCPHMVWTYNSRYKADGAISYGGYADYIRVLGTYAFKIPGALPSDIAAPLLCAGMTMYTPMKELGVKQGDRVGIGGLGHLGIQFAKALGATAIAFSRSGSKKDEVLALGADEFVNYGDKDEAKTAAGTVDVLIITADATDMLYNTFLSFLTPRGTYVLVGLPNDEIKFIPFFLVDGGNKLMGSKIGSIADIKDMLALAAKKGVHQAIQKMPMGQVNEGLKMVRNGSVRYRVVLEN